jgi:hypothetical protein
MTCCFVISFLAMTVSLLIVFLFYR